MTKKNGDGTVNKDDYKTTTLKNYNKADLIYSSRYSFYKYHDIKKFDKLSFKSRYSYLANLYLDLGKLSRLKTQNENTKEKKMNV